MLQGASRLQRSHSSEELIGSSSPTPSITLDDIFSWSYQIARGMQYLALNDVSDALTTFAYHNRKLVILVIILSFEVIL